MAKRGCAKGELALASDDFWSNVLRGLGDDASGDPCRDKEIETLP